MKGSACIVSAHQSRQPLRAFAEIDWLRRHHHARRAALSDHFAAFKARITAVMVFRLCARSDPNRHALDFEFDCRRCLLLQACGSSREFFGRRGDKRGNKQRRRHRFFEDARGFARLTAPGE